MGSPRHVLVVIKGLAIGGAERRSAEAVSHWDRTAFRYSVAYALPRADALVADLEALGVDVTCLGRSRGLTAGVAIRLRRLIVDEEVALVHAHSPIMAVIARAVSPVPVVYTEHGAVAAYRRPTRIANRLTYRRNRAIIAVSQAVADSVASYSGPKPTVIPNGVAVDVKPEAASGARVELGLTTQDPLIVHIGNIRAGKGHEVLIDAAARLIELVPDATIVSIGAGSRGDDLDRLRRRSAEAGVSDRLRFLGARADALSFVAAADVYAHPSTDEGLPVAVLEAMALGLPIVATAVGGIPTIVRDGETGLLVAPGDPDALATGIHRLLEDRGFALRLGTAARARATEHHGMAPMVRAIESVYREVLGE